MSTAAVIRFDDAAARRRIRHSLDESLLVEAAAGTGKTSELVRRMVAVLSRGLATIDRMVAVTFTRKAAGELKLRLRQQLDLARQASEDPGEIRRLEDAVAHLEEARIGTIHSFCAELLRERPVEARVDPAFEEISEVEASRLYRQAFRGWIQRKLDEDSPGVRRCLSRLAAQTSYDGRTPMERLEDAGWELIEWRGFPAPWRRPPFDRQLEIDRLFAETSQLAALALQCTNPRDNLRQSLRPAIDVGLAVPRAEKVRDRDYDAVEALLIQLLRDLKRDKRSGTGPFAAGLARKDVVAARTRLLDLIEAFKLRADADLAALLRQELLEVVERYDQIKRRSGKLDFLDLLLLARDLVRDDALVRADLQEKFTHIFIDEFQDTDPLQAEILLLLSADRSEETNWLQVRPAPGKLFIVGDPKQSIYRFRRADVVLYQSVRDALVGRGVGLVYLTESFRSFRPVQQFVNAAFEPEMRDDTAAGQPGYVPLEQQNPAAATFPCLIALPAPRPYATERVAKSAIDACLPETVGAFVEWLVRQSGWQVRDPDDPQRLVPVTPGHVCILFRRFMSWRRDVTREYLHALEARGVPHVLLGARSFHQREEVETLRAALTAIEWPDDELSVFAALKGSLFAIPDDLLLCFRHRAGKLHPFRKLPDDLEPDFLPIRESLALLAELHRERNRRPLADTLNTLLEAARAHAGFALRPAGNQVLANVHRVADLARSFELGGGISFRGFVEELEAQAEKEDSVEAPVLEEGAEGVRLMTVHTAKGLEFPVVILADMTANLAASQPERYIDAARGLCAVRIAGCAPWELVDHLAEEAERDRAEGVRVAYVAATRARDLLVVPAVGDQEFDGWLRPLNKAIYPPRSRRRDSQPAPGCPAFGEATVLQRPQQHDGTPEFSVKPGLHSPQTGSPGVVWWDPGALNLNAKPNFGLRLEEILAEDSGGEASAEGLRTYQQWRAARARALVEGSRPQFDLLAASAAQDSPPGVAAGVTVDTIARDAARPSGRRFGVLVHTILRDVALDGDREAVARLANFHGRLLGAPREEALAAIETVSGALAHPVLARARAASRSHRELPVMAPLDGGRLLEGVLDLAFFEDGAWTVVDFKTDAELAAARSRYERQLQWYVYALSQLTGQPARGLLLSL